MTSTGLSIRDQVLANPLVIGLVVSYLDLRSLYKVRILSREWLLEAHKAICKRKGILHMSYVYDTCRRPDLAEVHLLNQLGLLGHTKRMLIDHVTGTLKDHLWSQPKFGFMFHSGTKTLQYDLMKSVKGHLPPDCRILGLFSRSGLIPAVKNEENNSFVSCELQVRSLNGICYSFWPSFDGVELTVFDETSTLSEFAPRADGSHKKLKALFVFSTSYMTRIGIGRRESYKRFQAVNETFDAYKRKIALAGVVVDVIQYESTCLSEDDDSEEDSLQPLNEKSSQVKTRRPFLGVAISGERVKAASVIIDSDCDTCDQLETELMEFKKSLDFDADVYSSRQKTFGFLFTCSGRGPTMFNDANAETGVINKIFPKVYFTGIYGDGEFGENYWPKNHGDSSKSAPVTEDRQTGFWHFYNNVIALIHVEQG